ncbi:hypothetical protein MFIFM68171_08375 [Madurella fahalii]|uniref:DUF6594 domain-containing protein n=1 Tax=Madurella fahalii TaxID=1157608 RepID=A0ABQ0GKS5_9PEZI
MGVTKFSPCSSQFETKDNFEDMVHYSENKIVKAVGILALAVGCAMPAVSIYILYIVQGMTDRIGIIAVLPVFFALSGRYDVGDATGDCLSYGNAFAAVLVVFIGTDGGSSN